MAFYQRKNFSKSLVTDDPLAIGATTVNVTGGEGANFPASGNFPLVIWDKVSYPDPSDDTNTEIVLGTARSTDAITIVRAQESTADVAHAQGSAIELLITDGVVTQLEPAVNETPAGASNGTNTDFTLDNTPVDTTTVMVFLGGQLQTYTDDYTITGAVITFTLAPETSQKVRVTYWF